MRDPYFAPSFLLLQQEGYLCRSTLLMGLNALAAATPGEKGLYYAGFFQLSVGIERILKLSLIIDHMAGYGLAAPSEGELRNYGHDLIKLFDRVRCFAQSDATGIGTAIVTDAFAMRILTFLSSFAKTTRYYNLNRLSRQLPIVDPLTEWQRILEDLLTTFGNSTRIARRRAQAAALAEGMASFTFTVGHDLDQSTPSLSEWITKPLEWEEASRHVIWHVYRLLQAMRDLLSDACHRAQIVDSRIHGPAHVPVMYEFFDFLHYERRQVLRKRRWP